MVIGVDFDNTLVIDEWPEIGEIIPGALDCLARLKEAGHKLVLYTQRTDDYNIYCPELTDYARKYGSTFKGTVDLLSPALKYLEEHGLTFDAVNSNPWWEAEKQDYGRKVYFDVLIDDHNAGISRVTVQNSKGEVCEVVDWDVLERWLEKEGILKKNRN